DLNRASCALYAKLTDLEYQLEMKISMIHELEEAQSRTERIIMDLKVQTQRELDEKSEELFKVRKELEGQIAEFTNRLQEDTRIRQNLTQQKRDLELRLADLTMKMEMETKHK